MAELIRRHRERAFQAALSVLGSACAPEAEDAAQSAMLKACLGLAGFREEAEFGSWLYRIARREALNQRAKARHQRTHLGDPSVSSLQDDRSLPDAAALDSQRTRDLEASIGQLPAAYQSAVRLYYWLDWPISEISALLEAPENTIKSYLHRSRKLLHTLMQQKGYQDA